MYRKDGPTELKPLGETEFVNGIAAMSASNSLAAFAAAAFATPALFGFAQRGP